MRHFMLALFRRSLDGLALFRRSLDGLILHCCRPNDHWDLHSTPYHSSNRQLNSRERTFLHSAVCQLYWLNSYTQGISLSSDNLLAA